MARARTKVDVKVAKTKADMAAASIGPAHARFVFLSGDQQGQTCDVAHDRVYFAHKQTRRRKDDVELIISGDVPELDRLATLVRTGPDRYEVHNLRPWDEVLLNGTRKVPFGARPLLHHGDTLTVRGIVVQFLRVQEAEEDSDVSEGMLPGDSQETAPLPPLQDVIGAVHDPEQSEFEIEGAEDIKSEIVQSQLAPGDTGSFLANLNEPATMRRTAQLLERLGELAGVVETKPFFRRFLSIILEQFPKARGTILVFDSRQGSFRRVAAQPAKTSEIRVSRAVVRKVQKERAAVLSSDTLSDERLKARDSVVNYKIRSVLCVPIIKGEEVYGVIHLDGEGLGAFNQEDLNVVAGIAPQAVLALENSKALERMRARDRAKAERILARAVQQSLTPQPIPDVTGLDIAARMLHAEDPSGDFYDIFTIHEGGGAFIFLGHGSVRGVAGALFLTAIKSALRAYADASYSPLEILRKLSGRIRTDGPKGRSMMGLLLFWDATRGRFAVAGAGEVPLILYRPKMTRADSYALGGTAIGASEDPAGDENAVDRGMVPDQGDTLVLMTPGALKVSNDLTVEILSNAVEKNGEKSAETIADALASEVTSRAADNELSEDVTFIVLRRPR